MGQACLSYLSNIYVYIARDSQSSDLRASSDSLCYQLDSPIWTMQGSSNVASTSALQSEASRKSLWQPSHQEQAPGPLHPSQQEQHQQQQHADFLHGEDGDPHHPTKILQRSRTPTVSPDYAPLHMPCSLPSYFLSVGQSDLVRHSFVCSSTLWLLPAKTFSGGPGCPAFQVQPPKYSGSWRSAP